MAKVCTGILGGEYDHRARPQLSCPRDLDVAWLKTDGLQSTSGSAGEGNGLAALACFIAKDRRIAKPVQHMALLIAPDYIGLDRSGRVSVDGGTVQSKSPEAAWYFWA